MLHSLPTGFSLDGRARHPRPEGHDRRRARRRHACGRLRAAAARNLMLAIERCHLAIEAMVATPYAAGLSALVDDEAETRRRADRHGRRHDLVGVFAGGHLAHVDAIAVGGNHVTMDIARGLTTRVADCRAAEDAARHRHRVGLGRARDDRGARRSARTSDQPRTTCRNRSSCASSGRASRRSSNWCATGCSDAGFAAHAGRRIVLTGGASQLTGVPEVARRIISPQVRIGRPLGIQGLPESAKGPAFAAAVGLLIYPQVAACRAFRAAGARRLRRRPGRTATSPASAAG